MIADGAVSNLLREHSQQTMRSRDSVSSTATAKQPQVRASAHKGPSTATLTEPFDAMSVKEQRKSHTGPGIIDMRDVNIPKLNASKHTANGQTVGKGAGWRNDPLVKEQPVQSRTRKNRGRQVGNNEDANGWATEEANDIADLGDFDFTQNLAKFDKQKVFDDIRKDDTTADEDRLVSFNKIKPRAGTDGGRNLHHTENVLDVPDANDASRWKSEAGETEDEMLREEQHYSSGRSRRGYSRRPLQSRKGSMVPSFTHLDNANRKTGSPRNGSIAGGVRAAFKIAETNRTCQTVSPLQMLELEQLCTTELGVTEDMLTENAGRSIAEAVIKNITDTMSTTNGTVPATPTDLSTKNILFLVGNHKTAARALSAARHLRNRRARTTAVVLGHERGEEHLLESVRKQLTIYKNYSGRVEQWDEYRTKLPLTTNESPDNAADRKGAQRPDLIVDALLGIHSTFEELRTDDQATVFSMVKWSNSQSSTPSTSSAAVSILSLDVPTGLSATTGLTSETDDVPLIMRSSYVICLAAPKTGLLAYLQVFVADGGSADGLEVTVADIGLSGSAWNKLGSRRRHGPDFGGQFVLPLRLVVG